MTRAGGKENRRTVRVAVSKGVWVAWQAGKGRNISRVRDLSAGGVFISTALSVSVGTAIEMLVALPEGEARIHGIVRYADEKTALVWNSRAWVQGTARVCRSCCGDSIADRRFG